MGIAAKGSLGWLSLVVSSLVVSVSFARPAIAQTAQSSTSQATISSRTPSVQDAVLRAYYSNDGDFFRNRGVVGQLNWLFGPFVENQVTGDGAAVNRVYQDALRQQNSSDPTVRTADLENPYNTSLQLLPTASPSSTLSTGSEIVPFSTPTPVAPAAAPPAAPTRPIPALW